MHLVLDTCWADVFADALFGRMSLQNNHLLEMGSIQELIDFVPHYFPIYSTHHSQSGKVVHDSMGHTRMRSVT